MASHSERWRLQREGARHAERLFSDHDETVKWARRHAQAHAPCRLKIQGHSGRVREQIDFAATSGATLLAANGRPLNTVGSR